MGFYIVKEDHAMTQQDLIETLEEGVKNGRIAPHLAAFIAADLLGTEAQDTDFDDVIRTHEEDTR